MQKSKLDRFIQKYSLSGNVNSVKWKSDGDSLSTNFITPDKSLMGTVKLDDFTFESTELGIYTTDQLQKLLNVLRESIDLKVTKVDDKSISLNVKNGTASIDYNLSDLSVIPDTPKLKRIPEFETNIKLDSEFINLFIKGKSALTDVETFTILEKNGDVNVVIGYANTNTNRVNIPVSTTINGLKGQISFNANLFRDMLSANKECTSAVLEVSNEGLARVNFKVDDYDSTYYIVALQSV